VAAKIVFHNSKICFGGASDLDPDEGLLVSESSAPRATKTTDAAESQTFKLSFPRHMAGMATMS
jgi:hypothetical protein